VVGNRKICFHCTRFKKSEETQVFTFVTQVFVFSVGNVSALYEFELVAVEVMLMEIMEIEAGNCV
jgi:hypothetical protein